MDLPENQLSEGDYYLSTQLLDLQTVRKNFVEGAAPAATGSVYTGTQPIRVRQFRDKLQSSIAISLFGESGTGKTHALEGFLKAGLRILCLSTEVGKDGLLTIRGLREKNPAAPYWSNLYEVGPEEGITDFDQLRTFLKNPEHFWPEMYDTPLDMLAWDGFTEAQTFYLERYVADNTDFVTKGAGADRREGLFLGERDWGIVMRGTLDLLSLFMTIRNKKTGQSYHKFITCKEAEKEKVAGTGLNTGDKDDKARYTKKEGILLQGAAKKSFLGAMDFVIQTDIKGEAVGRPEYVYRCQASLERQAKKRVALDSEEPADMEQLWCKITRLAGMPANGLLAPVEVGV